MAVFSYTSQSTFIGSAIISDYADELISAYSDTQIAQLTQQVSAPNLIDVNFKNIEEEVTYSYNDSSAVYIIDEDFGSITESPVVENDYGSIVDNNIVGSQLDDYGLITINETLVPYGSIDIGDDSFAQLKLIKVDVGKVTLTILGQAYIFTTPIEFGSGTFSIKGTADPVVIKLSHVGSGQLSTLSGSAEVVGVKYPESTVLFRITGSAIERNTESYVGSGSLFGLSSATEVISSVERATGLFKIAGEATPIIITLSHVGSGSLFAFSSTTEAVGFNPPESTILFRFAGTADEQFVKNNAQTTEGSLILRGQSEVVVTKAQEGKVLLQTSGTAQESITPAPYIGSGKLFAFTGSSESITVDPVEETVLFRFSGTSTNNLIKSEFASGQINLEGSATTIFRLSHIGSVKIDIEGALQESITPAPHVGTGTLFAFTGSSESVTIDPPDKTTLFTFAGSATEKATNIYTGSGIIEVGDSSYINFSLVHYGSGSLFTFSSTTEAVVSNPPESTALFRITGKLAESITPAPHIGTGSLFTFISFTEATAAAERSKGLFKISGDSKNLYVINNIGSGSLFGFSSTTEAIVVNPPESTALFRFTGSAVEKNTESYFGSGSLFTFISFTESSGVSERAQGLFKFTGSAVEKNTESYRGSGSLFGFLSATEAVGSNPPESIALFKFGGSAIEKNTESYVGSGALFGFSSATEAVGSNPPESIALFKFSGSATESIAPAPHVGSGSIFTFVSATETRAISEVSTGRFKFSGSAVEKNTESYVGSGALFGFSSTTEAIVVNPPESTALFRFTGSATESTAPAPHVGSGSIFTFISFTETIAISPDDTKVLFTFVGAADNKKTDSYRGTGSLFAITGSYESTRVIAQLTGVLFGIFGRAFESFGYPNYDGTGFSQMEGVATISRVEFEPARPTRIIMI
jgi:hypothetical protein